MLRVPLRALYFALRNNNDTPRCVITQKPGHAFIRRVELLLFYFSVIYDDSLTDAFIETVLRLLKAKTQTILFLAIEKR